jgi:hypothetical protein
MAAESETAMLEVVEMPQGRPLAHRTAFSKAILDAMGEAHSALSTDGLNDTLVQQIIINTISHALAVATVTFALLPEDVDEVFHQYCRDVEVDSCKVLNS